MPRRRRTRTIWILAISVAVVGAIAAATAIVVPWVIAETEPRIADGIERVVLHRDGDDVAFTPGDGWVVHPRFGSDSTVDLVAPDQALTIELELVPDAAEAAVAQLIGGAADTPVSGMPGPGGSGGSGDQTVDGDTAGTGGEASGADHGPAAAIRIETLASGLELRHIEAEHGLLAVVGTPSGSVALTVRAGSAVDLAEYRTALAALLETIRPG
ncbi:hypothetical protein [Agromyces silvae]|uniref:hypothetical protein n=1 Tax=Agromyces silvae TaxID=3388266 RepID=UPI00280B1EEB|nr:hypothetical protein [Agromyces protaetiae]